MKLHKNFTLTTTILLLVVLCPLLYSCSSKQKTASVEALPAYQPSPEAPVVQLPTVVAPKPMEVQEAIARVFKDAVAVDDSVKPNFVAGDFNGDTSQDIAVVIKPAPGKVAELNQEYPPWIIRDPFSPEIQKTGAFRVEDNETLLAIIHGYGPNDWRDPSATQTFILKNAAGNALMVHKGVEFVKANSNKKLPRVAGDLIQQNNRGKNGYIYFSALTYRWYDPATYKPEPARRVGHPIMAKRMVRHHPDLSIAVFDQDSKSTSTGVAFMGAEELKTRIASNEPLIIIDVRSSNNFANSDRKIRGAIHMKVRKIKHRLSFAPLKDAPRDRMVVTYCACPADESSISAGRVFLENGFKNVRALKGGWNEWLKVSGQTETKQRGL